MKTKMKVDGYEISSEGIKDVIDKLAEADGSPLHDSRVNYLAEAARLLAYAIAEEVKNQLEEDDEN